MKRRTAWWKTQVEYDLSRARYIKERANYDEAWIKKGQARMEYDLAWARYIKAQANYGKARMEYDLAWANYDKARIKNG